MPPNPASAARSVHWLPDTGGDGWRCFEFSSRGDRQVAGLSSPDEPAPHALALALGPESAAIEAIPGLATLTLDLPLLGVRGSPKWSERLGRCLAQGPQGSTDEALLEEFLCQAASDVGAVLDVCGGIPELAGGRAGLLGLGPGALVGARLRGTEPRLSAFALSPAGLPPELDLGESLGARNEPPFWLVEDVDAGAARLREALV